MTKLKLADVTQDKPVRLTIEVPANVHRDLIIYAKLLGEGHGSSALTPQKLIGPMIVKFMANDREFKKQAARFKRGQQPQDSAR